MPFQLVRSFTIASLTMFVLVAAVLTVLKAKEGEFFEEAQSQQIRFFNSVQENFARQQDQAAWRSPWMSTHAVPCPTTGARQARLARRSKGKPVSAKLDASSRPSRSSRNLTPEYLKP